MLRHVESCSAAMLGLMLLATTLLPAFAQQPDGATLLAQADRNGDGQVTLQEFRDARAATFGLVDRDQNGSLSSGELKATLPQEARPRVAAMAFRKLDTDGDGSVTPAEYAAAPTRVFDRADSDSNGVLDASELAKAREAAKSRR